MPKDITKPDETPPSDDPKLPTVAEQVEQRKLRLKEKERDYNERSRVKSFNSRDEEPPEEEEEPAPKEKPPEDPKPEDDLPPEEEEEEKPEESDDDFDDFEEEEPASEEEKEEEPPAEEEPVGEGSEAIQAWRERVKEQGTKRKVAEARAVDLEGTVDSLEAKVRELEEKNKDIAASQINWNSHDVVKPLWGEFDDIVGQGARTFSDAATAKQFQQDSQSALLQEYYNKIATAKNSDDRLEVDIAFKQVLAERYNVEDGSPLVASVKKAMDKYMEIQDQVEDMKKKHEEGRLSLGVEQYHAAITPYEDTFEDLGTIDEEFINANPDSVEAVVGKRYAEDKEFRSKADKHKDRVKQFVFGLRPLTQDEMDKAEKRAGTKGMSLPEYLEAREVNFQASRKKFFNDIFYSGMAMEEFAPMRKIYSRYQSNQKKRAAAKKSISKSKDAAPPKKKEEKPLRTKDRPYTPPSRRKFD